eukprot:15269891-Alexandrium_andersonii.AAC.1
MQSAGGSTQRDHEPMQLSRAVPCKLRINSGLVHGGGCELLVALEQSVIWQSPGAQFDNP